MAVSTDVIIPLRGGASIRLELITWLLDAEDRGIRFATQPDGRVRMSPPDRVTVADVSFARAHRDEVRAAVAYCEQMLGCHPKRANNPGAGWPPDEAVNDHSHTNTQHF